MLKTEVFGAGRNIKCFDKIKLMHKETGFLLHNLGKGNDSASGNQLLTCHKARNQSDWFVVSTSKPENNNPAHVIQDDEILVLTHMQTKRNIHASLDFESPVCKQAEVSLCSRSGAPGCLNDQFVLKLAGGEDQYWRVGDAFSLISKACNSSSVFCHKKKLSQGSEWEVYCLGQPKTQGKQSKEVSPGPHEPRLCDKLPILQNLTGKNSLMDATTPIPPAQQFDAKPANSIWVICQHEPYIYTAPVSNKPGVNQPNSQESELQRLRQQKLNKQARKNSTGDKNSTVPSSRSSTKILVGSYNKVLGQIEEKKKPFMKKRSWWKKYLCCCFFSSPQQEFYQELLTQ